MALANQVRALDKHDALRVALLIQDSDGDLERRKGLEQARDEATRKWPDIAIAIACPHQCREAWLLGCLCDRESASRPHDHSLDESASRELARRIDSGAPGEETVLRRTPLSTMREFGDTNGLTAFLDELETRVPALL